MSRSAPDPDDTDIALFGERVLRIIDEGRRVATYKLALLLALVDACAAESSAVGSAPASLHTRVIASHVLRLYLPQAADFMIEGNAIKIHQINSRRSRMLSMVTSLQQQAETHRCRNMDDLRRQCLHDYEQALDEVERTFARYPIRLLQVVNGVNLPFLYDIDWDERVSLSRLHGTGGGEVRFRPGAGDALLRLGPLIRPLIETHWTRMVASINRIDLEEERLRTHLFGSVRRSFPPTMRQALIDLYDGRCFYCDQRLGKRFDLDHLIPWSRYPNDAIENLVPADPKCNGEKRDTLPAVSHLSRWSKQIETNTPQLIELARRNRWLSDHAGTLAIARSTYSHLPSGTPLWLGRNQIEVFDGDPIDGWLCAEPA